MRFYNKKLLFSTIIVDVILLVSVVVLMQYVQLLLREDARINLTEIVTQNKNVITSNLTVELSNLELNAKQLASSISAVPDSDAAAQGEVFLDYTEKYGDSSLIWSTLDGNAITASGSQINVSGRNYFRVGVEGVTNISDRLISRENGSDIFVICVPVIHDNKVIGTLQKSYSPQDMYELCAVSLYSDKGSSYIINSQGYILVCSEDSEYSRESDNYYRIIYSTDADAARVLEEDIKAKRSGFMNAVINGSPMFSAYTPIDNVPDWYLISSVSTAAVSPNANIVVQMFYYVLVTLTLLFAFSGFYYWHSKKRKEDTLKRLAFVDPVTCGDSATKFKLDSYDLLRAKPVGSYYLCTIDIDNFKYINRFYGYEKGDFVLKSLYDTCKEMLKENERVARTSADHFILLLDEVASDRLDSLVHSKLSFNEIQVYLSAGVYLITNIDENVDLMVDKASIAAHKVKGQHFKRIMFYSDEVDKEAANAEKLKRSVEQALENNEIIPFFQPKVNINTNELVGAEALARWRNKDGKLISPGEFLPVCEQTGLIRLVDMTIYEQTLRFISNNLANGVHCVPISVNFSRLHLLDSDFIELILHKLEQYNVPPELIELELTETVMFDNHNTIKDFISTVHAHGLRISMDDFGSGYSSLHMLKDIDIDVLKIDRGFLVESTSDERQKIIFGTIVDMARKLELSVIVEGVETVENVNLMKQFDCLYAQGYYFARPMDIESFEKLYKDGSI